MIEQPGVRARRQPERLHPGNHLKNLKNRADTFTSALVIAEEPESAESQEEREYSDLDLTVSSLARYSYGLLTLNVKMAKPNGVSTSEVLSR